MSVAFGLATLAAGMAEGQDDALEPAPTIVGAVAAADARVAGFLSPHDLRTTVIVVYVYQSTPTRVLLDRAMEAVVGASGDFAVPLRTPLKGGEHLDVVGVDRSLQPTTLAVGVDVPVPPKPPEETLDTPTIVGLLRDGGTKVSGFLPSSALAKSNRLVVLVYGHSARPRGDARSDDDSQQLVQRKIWEAIGTTGEFEVSLDQALRTGQTIHVIGALTESAKSMDKDAAQRIVLKPTTEVATADVISTGDWGRTRAYFAAGGILSNRRGNFSQFDPALTLLMDSSWWQREDRGRDAADHDAALMVGRPPERDGHNHPFSGAWLPHQVSSFFDARLTAVPVSDTTNAANVTNPSLSLESQKAALVEGGVYVPFYGSRQIWEFGGDRNALFVAPAARVGVLTAQSPQGPLDAWDVFGFWTVGVLFGHQKLSESPNRAPEVISFFHMAWGKYGNILSTDSSGALVKQGRFVAEGRLKIPETVFQIGFEVNIGDGQNDLRVLFGARFDIGDIVDKVKGASSKP